MNLNPITYLENTITPFDLLFSRFKDKKKIKIGWCGVFPPYQNGAAAVSHYMVKELLKREDIEVGVIPINGKIEKKLFRGAVFCTLHDPNLDVIIFWCLGHEANPYMHGLQSTQAKKMVWQTIHRDPTKSEKEQFKDIDKADHIVVMTLWAQKMYKEIHNQNKNKTCAYVPFGVDTEYFKPIEKKEKFEITFVSRAHYKKGIMPFLDAIPFVLEKEHDCIFNLHSPLDIFSPYFDEIEKRIFEIRQKYPHNFLHTATWVPYSKMKKVYEQSTVLVFPSNNEGFGVPVIEAMSSGVPCIVSDIPPLNELVTPETGFCLPQKEREKYHNIAFPDPKEIAEKIIFLKRNKTIYKALQAQCRVKVKRDYELKKCADLLVYEAKKIVHGE